jgi:predicted TIM-barrel fold metal-dependent hydrolase
MIVDAHVHILPDRVRDDPAVAFADPWFAACHSGQQASFASPEELIQGMDEDGVDQAICFTWPFADPRLCAEGNDWLAAAVRRHPARLIGFGVVQPADPGAAAEALRCARIGLRGLGELNADAQGWRLEDIDLLRPLAAASVEAALLWTLHCSEPVGHLYPGKGTATPDRVARLAAAFPELRLVLAHLGGGLPFYAHMPEVAELCRTNLWFDTAAVPFLYDPGVHADVCRLIGADRVLLGSDFPLLRAARVIGELDAAGLDDAQRAFVLGGSAQALLSL